MAANFWQSSHCSIMLELTQDKVNASREGYVDPGARFSAAEVRDLEWFFIHGAWFRHPVHRATSERRSVHSVAVSPVLASQS
jgi:hypothetical protein